MAWEQKNPGLALMSVAFAQEQVARLREMVDEIHSNPELKCLVGSKARILLAEAEAAFADIWAQSIEPRMREMLACLPPWLVLSAGDRQQLENLSLACWTSFRTRPGRSCCGASLSVPFGRAREVR